MRRPERFEISVSSAVKWLRSWHDHGVSAAKPCGVAFLFWKTMQIEYLRSLPSSRTEP